MRKTAKFLLALAIAFMLMLCFRATVFTICTVDGEGLEPLFKSGDRVLVNRWSYGLRVGGKGGILDYDRIGRKAVERGDIVAFENPRKEGEILICRCIGLPGDTIRQGPHHLVVPGRVNCSGADHYWMEAIGQGNSLDSRTLGFIHEELVIGKAVSIAYSHDTRRPLWSGWDFDRILLSVEQ